MAQLTIYIDAKTRRKIEEAARRSNLSVSKWVKERLTRSMESDWPEGYFDLMGSLADTDLERPEQGSFADDMPRETL